MAQTLDDEPSPPARQPLATLTGPTVQRGSSLTGLYAVIAGLTALVALDLAAIFAFRSDGSTAAAVISAVSAPIAALIGAYFGLRTGSDAGSAGRDSAERSRDAAERTSLALAALMDPDEARDVLAALGVPVPPPSPSSSIRPEVDPGSQLPDGAPG